MVVVIGYLVYMVGCLFCVWYEGVDECGFVYVGVFDEDCGVVD